MKKIILFNGPPGSGKDTLVKLFIELVQDVFHYKMAYPLKDSCHKMLGLQGTLEDLEHLKEFPISISVIDNFARQNADGELHKSIKLEGNEMSLRQFYIHLSENFMKPTFGDNVFGELAVSHIKAVSNRYVGISDCGFAKEIEPLIREFGVENFILVRVHREGKDFSRDSRSYISLEGVKTYDVQNNGTIYDLQNKLADILREEQL